jgi:peptidoglycan/LPS O-acetylase OafA/YrhL
VTSTSADRSVGADTRAHVGTSTGLTTGTMPEGSDRKFPTLTAVRGIGAIMVVTTHSAFNTGEILRGWHGAVLARFDFGVTLFFILSGFLLSRPFLLAVARGEHRPSVRHYLWKRALRVLPLYWLVVIVAMTFTPANQDLGWQVWVRNLTLTQLYFPTLLPEALTQMWSLCTEVVFYLLLPWLVWAFTVGRRRDGLDLRQFAIRAAVVAALGVAWQASWAHVPGREGHMLQWLPGYLPWFLAGMAFAAVSASLAVRPRPHALERLGSDLVGCWILATAVFAVACTPVAGPLTLAQPTAWEAATKCVLYTVAGSMFLLPLVFGPELEGRARRRLAGPVPTWLGDISYGVFAIHLFVMGQLFDLLDIVPFTGHFLTILVLDLAITFGLATLSFRYFERPILRFKNVRWAMRLEPRSTRRDRRDGRAVDPGDRSATR